ncbi:tetratricopeptide repeat protein [Halodesulfovibrio aestuarii]|uniref:Tetratricopeptide repeat protein n=1 Tax=Halodesulfovibrio aestuarii TaxID=126333 RepID=A0A8G2F959_9BACT|nr:tetratricopeptide repeat protein [Halodesulfovibrio aestuarii]SHJ75009.1 hypothetical protein SAMN05660830_03141 [Halodesulfovibrio aestuarii]
MQIPPYVIGIVAVCVTVIIFCMLFRRPLSNLLERTTKCSFANDKTSFELHTKDSSDQESIAQAEVANVSGEPHEDVSKAGEGDVNIGLFEAIDKLHKGNVLEGKDIFQKHLMTISDEAEIIKTQSIFFCSLYTKGGEIEALRKLKSLASSTNDEDVLFVVLQNLSTCYLSVSQEEASLELWEKYRNSVLSKFLYAESTLEYVNVLIKIKRVEEAKEELVALLDPSLFEKQVGRVYLLLSDVEVELGNEMQALFCADCASDYLSEDESALFNAAYLASKGKKYSLAMPNYIKVLSLNATHDVSLNNLGVLASDMGFPIMSVDYYNKSSNLGYSLAIANKGRLLLTAGFVEEATELIEPASKLDSPHLNVYEVLKMIKDRPADEEKKWKDTLLLFKSKQSHIRTYTTHYYNASSPQIEGKWFLENDVAVVIKQENNIFKAVWEEGKTDQCSLTFTFTNSSCAGTFKKEPISSPSWVSGSTTEFLGYLANNSLILFSEKDSENEEFVLTRSGHGNA